jgi:hypothetical protein
LSYTPSVQLSYRGQKQYDPHVLYLLFVVFVVRVFFVVIRVEVIILFCEVAIVASFAARIIASDDAAALALTPLLANALVIIAFAVVHVNLRRTFSGMTRE